MKLLKNKLVWCSIIIVAIGLYFYSKQTSGTLFLTERSTISDIEVNILADGKMEAFEQVDVGAQVSGQVKKMHVQLGDSVKKGQLIVEIDDLPQQNTVKDSEARLKNTIASKVAKEAQLINAQINLERQKRLIKNGATTQSDFDLAEANLKVYQAELDALEAQISQAIISLDTAKIDLTYTKIKAPIDGVVVATVVKEGQTVNSVQTAPTLVKIANLSKMKIKAQISEADVTKVKLGMPAYFTTLGEPYTQYDVVLKQVEPATETFQTSIGNTVTNTNEAVYYNGLFEVDNIDKKFYIDMTSQVYLIIDKATKVLTIPTMALYYMPSEYRIPKISKDKKMVWVKVTEELIEPREVTIGISNNVNTEIKTGLKEGDEVVVAEMIQQADLKSNPQIRQPHGMGR